MIRFSMPTTQSARRCFFAIPFVVLFVYPVLAQSYDVVFKGGDIIDGSGSPAVHADVGVSGGVIQAIGDLANAATTRVIDISGKTLVPGFIDLHSHADGPGEVGGLRSRDAKRRAAPNLVAQGITTVVVNQDGRSAADIARQREQLQENGFGPNAILMVGHNSVRQHVLGVGHERPATAEEIAAMAKLVRDGMAAGAFGMSAGLEYVPGIWSTTDELVALVREIVPYRGVYIVHERSSGQDPMWFVPSQDAPNQPTMLDSIDETIAIAEQTGAVVVATHIKARGVDYWGSSKPIIEHIAAARARGVVIYADQYPYNTSGSDGSISLLPDWIARTVDPPEGAPINYTKALESVLSDTQTAALLAGDVDHQISRRGGATNIVIFDYPDQSLIGKSLADVALAAELTPREMTYKLQRDGYPNRLGGARLRGFSMSEEDIEAFAAQPWCATASDAGITLPLDGPVHARFYGTFPRKLRHYAMDRKVLSVEAAIRSMTSLPGEILAIKGRGLIQVGNVADIAVLDLATVADKTDFFNPHQYPDGVAYVMIGGALVVDKGELTWATPGKVLTPENAR